NLSAQPLVKAFNLQSRAIAQFREANQAVAQGNQRSNFYNSIMARSTSSGILLIQVAVLGLSAYMAFYGMITLGTLVSFQGLLLMMSNSLPLRDGVCAHPGAGPGRPRPRAGAARRGARNHRPAGRGRPAPLQNRNRVRSGRFQLHRPAAQPGRRRARY